MENPDESLLRDTELYLHQQIPITLAMGVRIEGYDRQQLILFAPLALNHNHLGTAFGGSLSALATLAGYSLIWLELRDHECHVVVRESTISYRRPVQGNLRAICQRPAESALARFRKEFERSGKARIQLAVTMEEEGMLAVEFSGTFVALR